MAKKIKFALEMKDGAEVRTMPELKAAFDLKQAMLYLADNKLEQWLRDRYYEDEADAVASLDRNAPDLASQLCSIFEVPYEEEDMSMEEAVKRGERIKRLKEITDDEELIQKIDQVAFSQEELADLLDEGLKTIYLCGNDFIIPARIKGVTYIGIQTTLDISRGKRMRCEENGITFINLLKEEEKEREDEITAANDIPAVLLCDSYGEDENFLAYVSSKRELYEAEAEDTDSSSCYQDVPGMDIQYRVGLKKIPTPDITKYIDASYNGSNIIYIAQDGQGKFLAVMNPYGGDNTILRRWDAEKEDLDRDYILGKKHILLRSRPKDGRGVYGERISIGGEIKKIVKLPKLGLLRETNNRLWEMPQGFYSVERGNYDYENGQTDILLHELLHNQTEIKTYKFSIRMEKSSIYYPCICSVYAEWDSEKIYFLFGFDSENCKEKSFFYVVDIKHKELQRAVNVPIKYNSRFKFSVKGNKIVYYEEKLMVLDMKSGRQQYLWDAIGEYGNPKVGEMKILGDYLYLKEHGENEHDDDWAIYRIKLDGSERTIIGYRGECQVPGLRVWLRHIDAVARLRKNICEGKQSEEPIEDKIKNIRKIC